MADLFSQPRHPYTKALLTAVPRLGEHGRFPTIQGSPIRVVGSLEACPFAARCPNVDAACRDGLPPLVADGANRRHRCLFPEGADG